MYRSHSKNIVLYDHDIPDKYYDYVHMVKTIAWDIETTGLDWHNDKIGICQLYVPNRPAAIIRIDDTPPEKLRLLLLDTSIRKVFHHAMFDLRFMSYYWKVLPQNIACTKIAVKLLDVINKNKHSLKPILKKYLGIEISKHEQLSNWISDEITEKQISYAVNDVMYLLQLLSVLEGELKSKNLLELAHLCFAHIPARVQLDILGYGDVYSY